MVIAKLVDIQIAYPSLAVTFNFTDDQNKLTQPQRQTFHIPVNSEEGQSLTKETLMEKVKVYIAEYEKMLDVASTLSEEVQKEFDSQGEVAK